MRKEWIKSINYHWLYNRNAQHQKQKSSKVIFTKNFLAGKWLFFLFILFLTDNFSVQNICFVRNAKLIKTKKMKKSLLAVAAFLAMGLTSNAQLTENFETTSGTSLPTGWTQTIASGTVSTSVGWNSGINTTIGSTGFNMNSHTRFVGVNDRRTAGANNSNSFLKSPVFSLPTGNWWLKFDCVYLGQTFGGGTESGTVEMSTDGGTTWTVVSTLTGNVTYWWEMRYIDISAYAGGSNLMLGFRYNDGGGQVYGYCIDDLEMISPATNDASFAAIAPATGTPGSYGLGGSNISILGQVYNNGATTITSLNAKYVFNGGAVVTNAVTGLSIAPFTSGTFTATTPVTLPAAVGPYPLKAWVELTGDTNAANDTAEDVSLNTVAFMPVKKLVVEEATGTWCQWCPRGIVFMDSLHALYGDAVSLIAVHNNDPMEVAAYDSWMGTQVGGYPSAMVDRRYEVDPGVSLLDAYTQLSDDFAYATVSAVPTLTGSSLSVAVTVKPAVNINGAKLALVITEDDLKGTASGWNQANAYSGSSTNILTGGGKNYNTLPNPIPAAQMSYEFVARSIDPSATGGAGLLPASMVYNTDYTYTFNKTLDAAWVTNKIHGVILLIDGVNGAILNSANFAAVVGVSDINAGVQNFVVAPNPASTQANVIFDLQNSGNVSVTVFDMVGRAVYTVPSSFLNAGTSRISLPLDNFSTGLYNVKVQTENGTITGKFNVVK